MAAINQATILEPKTVTTVGGAERDRAISTIVTAFSADPVARWIYPDPRQYLVHFPEFIDLLAGEAFDHGTAHAIDGFAGAALWLRPGVHGDEEAIGEHLNRAVAPQDQQRVFAFFDAMDACFPKEPVWYLPLLGVDPRYQGRGYGSALLRHALTVCDEQHLPAYLESSNERNIPLYERNGFEVVARVGIDGSPPFWPMYRKPC